MSLMADLVHVTAVEATTDHCLRLTFEDGTQGTVDLTDREWHGVFAPLADPAYFSRVSLDEQLGTIVWPNGADFAPETLYTWVRQGAASTSS